MIRKEIQAEKQNKIVDMLPFFYNMITHSNMIGNGKCPMSKLTMFLQTTRGAKSSQDFIK